MSYCLAHLVGYYYKMRHNASYAYSGRIVAIDLVDLIGWLQTILIKKPAYAVSLVVIFPNGKIYKGLAVDSVTINSPLLITFFPSLSRPNMSDRFVRVVQRENFNLNR